MGANAQTSVPVFTSGQVLTAVQQNQINTGIPVFATTTTRDAAFGGAGEKTLAEGQLAYIEASDVVQYYNGSAWATLAPGAFSAQGFGNTASYQTTSSTTYTDLATVGPQVTITTGTTAYILATAWSIDVNNDGADAWISVAVSGATTLAASDNWGSFVRQDQNYDINVIIFQLTGLNAGSNTFTMKYKKNGGTVAGYDARRLMVIA